MNKLGVLMMGLLAVGGVEAKTCTWIGHTGNWSDKTKWEGGVVPAEGDDVVISPTTSGGGGITIDANASAKIASLTFASDGGSWEVLGGPLVLKALQNNSVPIANNVNVAVEIFATIVSEGDVDLVKKGTGTLILSGDNTFSGRLVAEEGRLQLETNASYGAVPTTYKSDAIILRNGGMIASSKIGGRTNTISTTRGITI